MVEHEVANADRPRVVIADDHPEILAAFGRLLRWSCKVVASAENGHGAVDAVRRELPDVLVVDLSMPDLDGFEVCRRIKHAVPDTIIVIVTALR